MKVYISADIEGVTGIAHWDEARKSHADYQEFREQMTREVAAACRGALAAGATELLVKDAHATGRNLLHQELPEEVTLVRGWAGDPMCMLQGLDESFAAVMMVGYHSRAGEGGNPLAHTLSGRIGELSLNGRGASEFLLHAHAASRLGVPVVLVTGDEELGQDVHDINEAIRTVASGRGVGNSTVAFHPERVVRRIEESARLALSGETAACLLEPHDPFQLRIRYQKALDAYKAARYPGMETIDATTVQLTTEDYTEVLRALLFVM